MKFLLAIVPLLMLTLPSFATDQALVPTLAAPPAASYQLNQEVVVGWKPIVEQRSILVTPRPQVLAKSYRVRETLRSRLARLRAARAVSVTRTRTRSTLLGDEAPQ